MKTQTLHIETTPETETAVRAAAQMIRSKIRISKLPSRLRLESQARILEHLADQLHWASQENQGIPPWVK